jgi:hypothetical protein
MLHDDSVIYDAIGLILADKFSIFNLTLHYFTSVSEIDIRLRPVSDQIWWRIGVAFDEPH